MAHTYTCTLCSRLAHTWILCTGKLPKRINLTTTSGTQKPQSQPQPLPAKPAGSAPLRPRQARAAETVTETGAETGTKTAEAACACRPSTLVMLVSFAYLSFGWRWRWRCRSICEFPDFCTNPATTLCVPSLARSLSFSLFAVSLYCCLFHSLLLYANALVLSTPLRRDVYEMFCISKI